MIEENTMNKKVDFETLKGLKEVSIKNKPSKK